MRYRQAVPVVRYVRYVWYIRCGDVPDAGGPVRVVLEEAAMPAAIVSGLPQPAADWNDGWTTFPSRVRPVPVTSSSFQSNSMTPLSESTNGDTKL